MDISAIICIIVSMTKENTEFIHSQDVFFSDALTLRKLKKVFY